MTFSHVTGFERRSSLMDEKISDTFLHWISVVTIIGLSSLHWYMVNTYTMSVGNGAYSRKTKNYLIILGNKALRRKMLGLLHYIEKE